MITCKANTPTYAAEQWNGSNVEECRAFHLAWFPQPPPPRPGYEHETRPPFVHDPEASTITVAPGYTLNVGDWLVNGGTFPPGETWAGNPEVVKADEFIMKYSQEQ